MRIKHQTQTKLEFQCIDLLTELKMGFVCALACTCACTHTILHTHTHTHTQWTIQIEILWRKTNYEYLLNFKDFSIRIAMLFD